tara:strand:+ start:220 stop:411 length:192 start_codon:yes stop_codon:yes gene_type:complete
MDVKRTEKQISEALSKTQSKVRLAILLVLAKNLPKGRLFLFILFRFLFNILGSKKILEIIFTF